MLPIHKCKQEERLERENKDNAGEAIHPAEMGTQHMVQKLGNDAISSQKLYPGIGSDKWRRQVGDDNKYVKNCFP